MLCIIQLLYKLRMKRKLKLFKIKIQMYQHKVNQLEQELSRIRKKLLNDQREYKNGKMEIKRTKDFQKSLNIENSKNVSIEFVEMANKRTNSMYTSIIEENENLKNCFIDLQKELNKIIESKSKLIFNLNPKLKLKILKDANPKLFDLKKTNPDIFKFVFGNKGKDINKTFSKNIK